MPRLMGKRYIDADALMTELSTMYKEPTSTEDFMTIGYDKAIADVVVTAHRQPTADAVEVIRCRYCRGWDRENGYCVEFLVTDPNGYCSFGERKE